MFLKFYQCDPVLLNDVSISAMLYADDIVLMSRSRHGLQQCLDGLQDYCNKWKLKVNIDKTKVMIFNTSKKADQTLFTLNGTKIEIVNTYIYLGIMFQQSGTFTSAKKHLSTKAAKAYYLLSKQFNQFNGTSVPVLIKLFDTMESLLLYMVVKYGEQWIRNIRSLSF